MIQAPFTIVLVLLLTFESSSLQCFNGTFTPMEHSGTKTPYPRPTAQDKVPILGQPPGCQPDQVWMLVRHGTRYPSRDGITLITERLPEIAAELALQGSACPELRDILESWKAPEIDLDMAKNLHPQGEMEMILLAERLQTRLSELLSPDYHDQDYVFRATETQRARQSQFHFATGLFGRQVAYKVNYQDPILPHDPVSRFYKLCPRWLRDVKHDPSSLVEQRAFESGPLEALAKRLSQSLGLELSLRDLYAIYVGCVFAQAWHPDSLAVPWCALLDPEARHALEYHQDLEHFWQDGPGFQINSAMACVAFKDLFRAFESPDQTRGTFYFSHSGAVLKMLTHLGLFKDLEPMLAAKFDPDKYFQFRTSAVDPFGANIGFVKVRCEEERVFRVGLLVNEVLTRIPGCRELWCEIRELKRVLNVDRCDFEDVCHVEEEAEEILKNAPDDKF